MGGTRDLASKVTSSNIVHLQTKSILSAKIFGMRLASRKHTKNEGPLQSVHVYITAKVTSKKVTWKYIQDEKHWFVLNTPIPDPGSCTSMLKGAVTKEHFEFLDTNCLLAFGLTQPGVCLTPNA